MPRKFTRQILAASALLAISGFSVWQISSAQSERLNMAIPGATTHPVSPNVSNASYTVDQGVKVFHLTAEKVKQEVSKGVFMNAWGYNGGTPGPTIVVHQGDTIRVVVSNRLPVPTSVHWHGLNVPNSMDGVPGIEPSPAILPGKSFSYQFKVKQVGTFMYHSHLNPAIQEMMGLDGVFISLPKRGRDTFMGKSIQHDYTLLLQEWSLQKTGTKQNRMPMGSSNSNTMTFGEGQVPAGNYDINPESMSWNVFTFNGKQYPTTAPLTVKKGDRVLIRLANLSMENHPIHLHGHNFTIISKDGNEIPKTAQYQENTVNVAPGETYDILLTANNPGNWPLHCHLPHHTMGINGQEAGMMSILQYVKSNGKPYYPLQKSSTAKSGMPNAMGNMSGM